MYSLTEVYGNLAKFIDVDGDCWVWTGNVDSRVRPAPVAWYRGKFIQVRSYGLQQVNAFKPGHKIPVCGIELCVNPDHVALETSDPGKMIWINDRIYQDEECQIWTDAVDSLGQPVMYHQPPGSNNSYEVPVQKFVWYVENHGPGYPWPTSEKFEASCGRNMCVAPEHVQVATESVLNTLYIEGEVYA